MSKFGLKIAQPNKNALSQVETDLVFSNFFKTLPVFQTIRVAYNLPSSDSTRRFIRHGLPFAPFYLIFFKGTTDGSKYQLYPTSGEAILTTNDQIILLDRVDKENISFVTSSSAAGIINITIIVFAFPIAISL